MAAQTMKFIKLIFKVVCVSLAVYMTILEALRFQRNEDVSSITFKELNQNPQDQYPTITFCFNSFIYHCENGIYDKLVLVKALNISHCQFLAILSGEDADFKDFDLGNLTHLNFEATAMNFGKIFTIVGAHTVENMYTGWWNGAMSNIKDGKLPMHLSYLDPTKICFSRKPDFDLGILIKDEIFEINKTYLQMHGGHLMMNVFIHYQQQAIRSFRKNNILLHTHNNGKDKFSEERAVFLSHISVLRKRNKSKNPCIQDPDHDRSLMEIAMRQLGCIPPYLGAFTEQNLVLPYCDTLHQLKANYDTISNWNRILTTNNPPCDTLTAITEQEPPLAQYWTGDNNYLKYFFRYQEDVYQEITNKRDFGFDGFWASVGGFVGIFLGYSLLQVPELMLEIVARLQKLYK